MPASRGGKMGFEPDSQRISFDINTKRSRDIMSETVFRFAKVSRSKGIIYFMKHVEAHLMFGDCRKELKKLEDNSVDLIFTSPPYADSRKNTYGGVSPDKYVDWFLPISQELLRVLKPTGTFVLNIKEKVVSGERHTYVIELILEMRKQGWLWTEEFIWHKKNSYPGKWPNRFRDSWERLLQFNKDRQFQYVPRRSHGSNGRLGRQTTQKFK